MRILVTGLGGFTGQHLYREFSDAGHSVVGLEADVRDADAVRRHIREIRPDALVHLAAQAFVAHNAICDFYDVNLQGTVNLLEAIAEECPAISIVLIASSASVYGNAGEGQLSEDMREQPENHYGVSKLAMEHAARLYGSRLPITIARPFNYTGRGQSDRFLVPKIVKHFREREPVIELGNLDVLREFGDVRSVVRVYCSMIEEPHAGVTVNVCTGSPHALREIIDICTEITGHRIEVKINPEFVRKNEVRSLAGDPTLLQSLVPLGALPTLTETLRWMLED